MKVDKKELDSLNAELTFTIEKEDYLDDYQSRLKSLQAKSHLKGFRKGKTPISMIKKMYGAQTLQESVTNLISEKINELITGDEYNIIGEPLYLDEENPPELDHTNLTEYTYRFEIGLEPEFEVKGLEEGVSFTKYEIEISDKMIDEEVENITKRMGKQESTDENISDGDVIYLKAQEKEGDSLKEEGIESTFSVQLDSLTEEYQKALKGSKKGHQLDIDVYNLEKDLPKESVEKYLLKLSDEDGAAHENIGPVFSCEITDVIRNHPANFDQDFFDKYFGKDEVKTEEEARGRIKEYLNEYHVQESKNFLSREVMESLMDKNDVALPEAFLKKWINKEQAMTEDQLSSFYKEMKWSLIKKKLVNKFEIKVEEPELMEYFVRAVRNYSPYIDEVSLKNTVFSLMKNREQLNKALDVVSTGKLFDKIQEDLKTEAQSIAKDDFLAKVKEINAKIERT